MIAVRVSSCVVRVRSLGWGYRSKKIKKKEHSTSNVQRRISNNDVASLLNFILFIFRKIIRLPRHLLSLDVGRSMFDVRRSFTLKIDILAGQHGHDAVMVGQSFAGECAVVLSHTQQTVLFKVGDHSAKGV